MDMENGSEQKCDAMRFRISPNTIAMMEMNLPLTCAPLEIVIEGLGLVRVHAVPCTGKANMEGLITHGRQPFHIPDTPPACADAQPAAHGDAGSTGRAGPLWSLRHPSAGPWD